MRPCVAPSLRVTAKDRPRCSLASSNADVATAIQSPKKPDGALDASMTRHSLPPGFPSSDPYIVDVSNGKVTLLARAAGFERPSDADIGRSYLPYGLDDAHHNYNTTVSPVASGGYFWVFFDSLRNYGNRGLTRAIWEAAVDIHPDGGYTTDPSHPAFYVAGQEFGPDNHRAFAARDLCKNLEEPCASGVDCCTGFCSATRAEAGGVCVPPSKPAPTTTSTV